jgi:hypothetical protein
VSVVITLAKLTTTAAPATAAAKMAHRAATTVAPTM